MWTKFKLFFNKYKFQILNSFLNLSLGVKILGFIFLIVNIYYAFSNISIIEYLFLLFLSLNFLLFINLKWSNWNYLKFSDDSDNFLKKTYNFNFNLMLFSAFIVCIFCKYSDISYFSDVANVWFIVRFSSSFKLIFLIILTIGALFFSISQIKRLKPLDTDFIKNFLENIEKKGKKYYFYETYLKNYKFFLNSFFSNFYYSFSFHLFLLFFNIWLSGIFDNNFILFFSNIVFIYIFIYFLCTYFIFFIQWYIDIIHFYIVFKKFLATGFDPKLFLGLKGIKDNPRAAAATVATFTTIVAVYKKDEWDRKNFPNYPPLSADLQLILKRNTPLFNEMTDGQIRAMNTPDFINLKKEFPPSIQGDFNDPFDLKEIKDYEKFKIIITKTANEICIDANNDQKRMMVDMMINKIYPLNYYLEKEKLNLSPNSKDLAFKWGEVEKLKVKYDIKQWQNLTEDEFENKVKTNIQINYNSMTNISNISVNNFNTDSISSVKDDDLF